MKQATMLYKTPGKFKMNNGTTYDCLTVDKADEDKYDAALKAGWSEYRVLFGEKKKLEAAKKAVEEKEKAEAEAKAKAEKEDPVKAAQNRRGNK